MKIHSDVLTRQDFYDAAQKAGYDVDIVKLDEGGSRSRQRGFTFYLTGTSSYRAQWWDGYSDEKAATWDEWGMFLAHLFDVDAAAHCGKNSYLSAAHFHWVTADRFRTLTPPFQHKRHRWENVTAVTSTIDHAIEFWCDCGAVQRHMAYGHSFDESVLA